MMVAAIVVMNQEKQCSDVKTAGGWKSVVSLKDLNDTLKMNMKSFAAVNKANSENLAQVTSIVNLERDFRQGFYYGLDGVGTVSTQFGIMAPTLDVRGGVMFHSFQLEVKVGNFTRNSVTTNGFDPQFANQCILWGESAPVSNAVQVSLMGKNTKVAFGHQGGDSFYSLNGGNYYFSAEQKVKNVSLSGGVDLGEATTGYAAVKWSTKNNVFTLTGNKLGSADKNFVFSYVRNNIPVAKGMNMSLGNALFHQGDTNRLHLVATLHMGRFDLSTQTGGTMVQSTFTPLWGLGVNYKM